MSELVGRRGRTQYKLLRDDGYRIANAPSNKRKQSTGATCARPGEGQLLDFDDSDDLFDFFLIGWRVWFCRDDF